MKKLINTPLFELFHLAVTSKGCQDEKFEKAYNQYIDLLVSLSKSKQSVPEQLREVLYARIELRSLKEKITLSGNDSKTVFIYWNKTLALLDAEVQILKEFSVIGMKNCPVSLSAQCKEKNTSVNLLWKGSDHDLIELIAALMAAEKISTETGNKPNIVDIVRAFEDMFNIQVKAIYTKRGKVFDRCKETTPFLDSLKESYNHMLEERLK